MAEAALAIAHLSLVFAAVIAAVTVLVRGRPSTLALGTLGYVTFTSAGLAIAPFLPLESISYLTDPVFLINDGNVNLYIRQLTAHWIFLGCAIFGLLFQTTMNVRTRRINEWTPAQHQRLRWLGILMLVAGSLAMARYFFLGPGLDLLLATRLQFSSTGEAVAARSAAAVGYGEGAYMAALAASIALPTAAMFLGLGRSSRWPQWLLFCAFLSFCYAYQTRQKAPLLTVALTYSLLWALLRHRSAHTSARLRRPTLVLIFGLSAFIGGIVLYAVNFGLALDKAVISLLARVFVIPPATETNFFAVFPSQYDFRGLKEIFVIPLGRVPVPDDVTIFQVAEAAVGNRFSSNASFVAVAWSGAGYLGVTLVSVLFVAVSAYLDRHLMRLPPLVGKLVIALCIQSLLGLTSGSLLDFMRDGGFIIPLLTIGGCSLLIRMVPMSLRSTVAKVA